MVDIARPPEIIRKKKMRRAAYGVVALTAVLLITVGVSRLKPAAPPVERGTVWIQPVTRGPMIRNVRGTGRLVPLEINWVAAPAAGRVDRILLRPGVHVDADTVVMELSNLELVQQVEQAKLELEAAQARLAKARADVRSAILAQEAVVADVEARHAAAAARAKGYEQLNKEGLADDVTTLEYTAAAKGLASMLAAERKALEITRETGPDQVAAQQAEVNKLRTLYELRRKQLDNLRVRAGLTGMLQEIARFTPAGESTTVELQPGARVVQDQNLFRVADPRRLKAELRIPETQARDVAIGQQAQVDTRNGIVKGVVSGIAGAASEGTVAVDVTLKGKLPRGARPNLTVDGTITLERLPDVVKVGRPAFGQEGGTITLFKLLAKAPAPPVGEAVATKVQIGAQSVNEVEVLEGLQPGDQVILSDMTQFDDVDRIRVVN